MMHESQIPLSLEWFLVRSEEQVLLVVFNPVGTARYVFEVADRKQARAMLRQAHVQHQAGNKALERSAAILR